MKHLRSAAVLAAAAVALTPAVAGADKASHKGWPTIDGVHRSNPGRHSGTLTGLQHKHNELLGGHGNDVLIAGDAGDVLWGDRYPSGQPTGQHDVIRGGRGKDFIYGGHGYNEVHTGGGHDMVRIHYGRGVVHCDTTSPTVYVSHRARPRYTLRGCRHVSYRTDEQVNGG